MITTANQHKINYINLLEFRQIIVDGRTNQKERMAEGDEDIDRFLYGDEGTLATRAVS